MQSKLPEGLHVAIIMDGNGRWATRRGLPRVAGHRAGVAAVRRIVERAPDLGISRLTLYAFSSENWRRPASEVQSIFWLLRAYLRLEKERLRNTGVRLEVIGRRDRLPELLLRLEDNALLVGAIASFAAVAGAMYFTRFIDWYSSLPASTVSEEGASPSVPKSMV